MRSVRLQMACWCSVKRSLARRRRGSAKYGLEIISSMVRLLPRAAFIVPGKKRTAEDGRFSLIRFMRGEQRDDGRPARIIACVTACARNATAKEQLSLC